MKLQWRHVTTHADYATGDHAGYTIRREAKGYVITRMSLGIETGRIDLGSQSDRDEALLRAQQWEDGELDEPYEDEQD